MLNKVFDPNNLVFRILARGVDLVGLSICWAMLCLPIVTVGPATAALYYTVVKVFRQGEDGAFGLYFKAFVSALKRGIPLTVLCEVLGLGFAYGVSIMAANAGTDFGMMMYIAYRVVLVLPIGMVCYLLPMLGRFDMTLGGLLSTGFQISLRHLFSTVIQALLVMEVAQLIAVYWWPVLFMPALTMLIFSFFQEKIYLRYLPREQQELLNPNLEQEEAELARMKERREARRYKKHHKE